MDDLRTAEAVTRFLRSKTAAPEAVVTISNQLLLDSLPVYLPNKTHFVFELICDRMNDTGSFKEWKFTPGLWQLWQKVWTLLDAELRAKTFRKVKFVSITAQVLEHSIHKYDENLLLAMFEAVHTVMAGGYVEVDEYAVVGLLGSYTNLLNSNKVPESWTDTVSVLFSIPRLSTTYKPTKKSTARYFAEVLPLMLELLSRDENTVLQQINSSVLFGEKSLLANIDTVLAKELSQSAVEYLFKETLSHLAAKDIASCEAVYRSITGTEKFAHLAELLLAVLAQINRALSSDFFLQLYDLELQRPHIRWQLVGYLVLLDPGLAVLKWEEIVEKTSTLNSSKSLETCALVAANLGLGFVRARDFSKFVLEVFPVALKADELWGSDEVLSVLAPKVNELSANQIAALVRQFLELKLQKPLALVMRGLLACPLSKQTASRALFEEFEHWNKSSEIAFYVLCIYGEPMLEKSTVLEGLSKYDFSLAFRIAELSGNSAHLVEKDVAKYVSQMNSHDVLAFARRWVVLMGPFKKVHHALFQRMVEVLDKGQFLNYFVTEGVTIYEADSFMRHLLVYLKTATFPWRNELFCILPPVLFRKYFSAYLNEISKEALDSSTPDLRTTLKHVLAEPTHASAFEKDFGHLRLLLATSQDQVSVDIAKLVWNSHIAHYNNPLSKNYVDGAMQSLLKKLKKPEDLVLAHVVLSGARISDEAFTKLHSALCDKYVKTVTKNVSPENLDAKLLALSELPLTHGSEIRKLIKKVGTQAMAAETKTKLFSLVAKVAGADGKGAIHVTSLYVALSTEVTPALDDSMVASLRTYYSSLSNEAFTEIYGRVLLSVEEATAEFLGPLVRVLWVLAPLLRKLHQKEHTGLFVATVLALGLRLGDIHEHALLHALHMLTAMLSDHMWACSQYAVEIVMGLADSVCKNVKNEQTYLSTVNLVSYVVLFHRFRFTSRYHLVVGVISHLMEPLSSLSDKSASAYARLLTALCEPSIQGSNKEDSLTSQAAVYKKALRKHAHVFLVNYIHLQLTKSLTSTANDALLPGIYSVFGVLSKSELLLANQCLDALGKTYYRTLYGVYKDHGKWKDQ